MNSQPLVSVITIFLSAEKYIEEAIESVLAQTYDNWELLLIDDGSTDSSTAIAQKYTQRYPEKIRCLEHEGHQNQGKSTSRNLGIYNSNGMYIVFLDADDVLLPRKLEQQLAILESQPEAAMVYGSTLYWHSWTSNPYDSQRDYIPQLGVQLNTLVQPPTLLQLLLGNGGAVPCICSFLVERQVVEEIGGFEESIQHLYEDQVFLAKIFLKVPVFVESGCWEKYRQHPHSSWHISLNTGQEHSARLIFLKWLENYLSKQRITNTEVWHALRKALWPYHHPILYRLSNLSQWIGRNTLPIPVRSWLKGNLLGALK